MFNKAILIGRLTAEPELRKTPNGIPICSFSIAVDRRCKRQDGERYADFINIVTWRSTAEFVSQYFRKGDTIGIEGSIQIRNYQDKEGNKRTAVEVVADHAFFSGGTKKVSHVAAQLGPVDFEEVANTQDLPF